MDELSIAGLILCFVILGLPLFFYFIDYLISRAEKNDA